MLEWLKTILGDAYSEEIDGKISEEIGKGFVARTDFNTVNSELKNAKASIKERDGQLEELKKSGGDAATLQAEITRLQGENSAKDKAHAKELNELKLSHAVEHALTAAGARNTTAAKALLGEFLSKAELGEDGTVKGLSEAIKGLTEDTSTSFLFESTSPKPPTLSGAQPAGSVTTPPDPKVTGYETRLAEARKNNDNLSAIKIKREAAAEGVILM